MSYNDPIRERFPYLFGGTKPKKADDEPDTQPHPPVESLHPGALPAGRTTEDADPIRRWWNEAR